MEIVDRADPPRRSRDELLICDAALDLLDGDSVSMAPGEGCRGEDLALLNWGLGDARLIDGDEAERLVLRGSFTRDRSIRVLKDWTRERGVDGTTSGAFLGDEFVVENGLLERVVRAEPATDSEALDVAKSR
jgi:hypothetical protein